MISSLSFLTSFGVLSMLQFADATTGDFGTKQIAEYGLIATAFLFILYRLEPRMKGIEGALNNLSRSIQLMLVEIKSTSPGVRAQAQAMIDEARGEEKK